MSDISTEKLTFVQEERGSISVASRKIISRRMNEVGKPLTSRHYQRSCALTRGQPRQSNYDRQSKALTYYVNPRRLREKVNTLTRCQESQTSIFLGCPSASAEATQKSDAYHSTVREGGGQNEQIIDAKPIGCNLFFCCQNKSSASPLFSNCA